MPYSLPYHHGDGHDDTHTTIVKGRFGIRGDSANGKSSTSVISLQKEQSSTRCGHLWMASSSCQYGSMSCCRFILSASTNLDSPETVDETRDTSGCHSCSDPAPILAAPHYGLRYGFAPATGKFQRLRGRPPLVSPLKSCMSRSFTAVPTQEKDQLRIGLTPKRALCPFCVLRN